MVTGQTAKKTNPRLPYRTYSNLTQSWEAPPQRHQKLSTQISLGKNLLMAEHTPKKQDSDSKFSINRLVKAIAGTAIEQRPQTATMLKPVPTKTYFLMMKMRILIFSNI